MHSFYDNGPQKKAWSKLSLDFFLKDNQHQLQNVRVLTLWPQIVGNQIAKVTKARKISLDTLIVDVKEQAWQIELSYQTPEILKKYTDYFKKHNQYDNTNRFNIKKIYFKYNPYFTPPLPTHDHADKYSNKVLIFPPTPTTPLPNQPKATSNADFKTSLDETLSRLKALWETQEENQATTSKITTKKITPIPSNEPQKKASPHHQDREQLYSTEKMNSNFLFSQDEFQPFDLY